MIFELAYHVQSFLCEHNKPPPKSFHEEMLERRAQEEQRRQLEAKRKEEEEVRPLSPRCPARRTASSYRFSSVSTYSLTGISLSFAQHLIQEPWIHVKEGPKSNQEINTMSDSLPTDINATPRTLSPGF